MGRSPRQSHRIPKLVNGRGTIPIDVTYKGVGRIRVSSGTTDDQTYLELRQMMDSLYNHGNLGTLEAIRSKSVEPLVVLYQTRTKGIGTSVTVNLDKPILESIYDWLDSSPSLKESTKKSYRGQIKSFESVVSSTDSMTVLVDRLKTFRKLKQKEKFHETFNKTKAVLMSYVWEEYGRTSQLYFEVSGVESLKRNRQHDQYGLEVSDVVQLTDGAPETVYEMVWSMCFTGMRPYEYLETNQVTWKADKVKDPISNQVTESTYIHKPNPGHGNKGGSRHTLNPFPTELVKPRIQYRQFNRYIKDLQTKLGRNISQTTFRHTFVHWCQLAGIPDTRIEVYQGYKHKGTLGIYKGYKDHAYMTEDNELLRNYISKWKAVKVNPLASKFFETKS